MEATYIFTGPGLLEEYGYRRCKFESRQVLRHLSPFPEAGEVLTAISSVCASLMKSDEQLGPRRFSFSTSLPSDI